ncbi:MAG: pre-16S rRNA-processing nuclease YqgF [bacterium]|nr:pre-16S rRNA-processing nuclease YqgF [bacterium]
MTGAVLGIDPGTRKAGYAVVRPDGSVVALGIEEIAALAERAQRLARDHAIAAVALGSGTNASELARSVASLGIPIVRVDERETTLRARGLYFADHPPSGWRRLIPLGMQVPPRPIDDYAAVLIARRYLADEGNRPGLV